MQKSTTVAARAIVMLACLVLIPLVALSGSSLPELAVKLLEGRSGREAPQARELLSQAPAFTPETGEPRSVGGPAAAGASAAWAQPPAGQLGQASPAQGVPTGAVPSPAGPPGVLPGGGIQAQTLGPGGGIQAPTTREQAPLAAGSGAQPGQARAGDGTSEAPADGGTFVRIQERLRDMGAVYYRLESWGTQSQLFRFQCEMAVESSRGLTRHFEAVDNHPLLAMQKVLAEVENWQASR